MNTLLIGLHGEDGNMYSDLLFISRREDALDILLRYQVLHYGILIYFKATISLGSVFWS